MTRPAIAATLLVLALAGRVGAQRATVCGGTERWSVKILTDDDSGRVALLPRPTTIALLARLPTPADERPNRRRLALERFTFRVRAVVVERHVAADDNDIHLVISDPADPTVTMVAEIPHPDCALGSRHVAEYVAARRVLARVANGAEIELEGVAFWDKAHGQSGMAPNAIELHPVLRLTPVDQLAEFGPRPAGARPAIAADTSSVRVWVNTTSSRYHCPGSALYGKTARGVFLTEAAARRRGALPADGRSCR